MSFHLITEQYRSWMIIIWKYIKLFQKVHQSKNGFKSICGININCGRRGWIVSLAGIIIAVYMFIDIDSRYHSVSDTLRNFVFIPLIIWAVYSLIAVLTSLLYRIISPEQLQLNKWS